VPPKGWQAIPTSRKKALLLTLVAVGAGFAILLVVIVRSVGSPKAPVSDSADSNDPGGPGTSRTLRRLPTIAAETTTPVVAAVNPSVPTHVAGPKCEACSVDNCIPATDGCDGIADLADRRLCEDLYACFSDPANDCVNQGDPVKCWCGTNPTTCLTDKDGPTRANGPCRDKVFAAARTNDPATIRARFVDPDFPLGRSVNLTLCRGSWCSTDCKVR
jgi:hypothetical protein